MLFERDPEAYEAFARVAHTEEGSLLLGALSARDGRLAYAAWLKERGDARGEALELAMELERDVDAEKQARLRALVDGIDAGWWRLVGSARQQLNCGNGAGEPRRVRFAFVCPMSWEQLAATAQPHVRFCDGCRKNVYRCETVAAADGHAVRGDCISVAPKLVDDHADRRTSIVGRPEDPLVRWARKLFGDER